MHTSGPRPAPAALACALACLGLPAAARAQVATASFSVPGLVLMHAMLFIITLILALLALAYVRQRRKLCIERKRFSVMLGNSFESVAELDLNNGVWLDYHILNGVAEKTRMPEPLDAYLERYVREHVYREDADLFRRTFQRDACCG